MLLNPTIQKVTSNIQKRSAISRELYLSRMDDARGNGPQRAHLSCGNQAHTYAAMESDKDRLANGNAGNIGIITAYNDMLSAHKPFETYPTLIKEAARSVGGTAQVAAGVPAMCDGITQGQPGMELSLFSRDTIAMAAAIGLSHNVFDSTVYLGVCDKIVPGLVIAAATFGHLPAVFLPAGPMPSGLPNDEKAKVRTDFACGKVGRDTLMAAEMASYHGPGTCTFYGTANTNQMIMEFLGLQLPGSSFVNPDSPLRNELTEHGTKVALSLSHLDSNYTPTGQILDERAYVNAIVGLMATGGSTNLLIHLIAMARASGVVLDWDDFSEISSVVPLLSRIYPNGLADINHFHAAGGLALVIAELLEAKLLHPDTKTIVGMGLDRYTEEPKLTENGVKWVDGARTSLNTKIIATTKAPFNETGGLSSMVGNLGKAVMKTSAVAEDRRVITAPARVFENQADVLDAFREDKLNLDVVVVVKRQGPKANGMPELHGLTPCLTVLQERGYKVALLTDGRMSGASGKVPAAIHVSPEAADNGPINFVKDGDMITVDAVNGLLSAQDSTIFDRPHISPRANDECYGVGRELFELFRNQVGTAESGASVFQK